MTPRAQALPVPPVPPGSSGQSVSLVLPVQPTSLVLPVLPDAAAGRRSAGLLLRSLFLLTKPRIVTELLVTTVPAMLLARRAAPDGWPSFAVLVLVTLAGGTLAAGSATRPVTAAQPTRTGKQPAAPPITMLAEVRRFSPRV